MVDSKLFWQIGLIIGKSCVCTIITFKINIPGHPYVLMNQSILCNCDIEAESNFLLGSLTACEGPVTKTDLEMHFTVNLAFVNYFDDMIEELGIFHETGQHRNNSYHYHLRHLKLTLI